MRTFPSPVTARLSWKKDKQDRTSLLSSKSTASPTDPITSFHSHRGKTSYEKQTDRSTPEKVQFVPAYDESMSPSIDTTLPLSSPERSFSVENEQNIFRSASPSYQRSSPVTTSRQSSRSQSPAEVNPRRRFSDPRNSDTTTPQSQHRKGGSTRIGRFASLFSSRAVVKNIEENKEPPSPSPPQSDSSSAYVGWPGTQDKRGATVAMEQSSYSDSEVGGHRLKSDSSAGDYNLAAAIVRNSASENSPLAHSTQEGHGKGNRLSSPINEAVNGVQDIYGSEHQQDGVRHLVDPWAHVRKDDDSESMSEVSTKYSKTSSAYFNPSEIRSSMQQAEERQIAAAAVMRLGGEPQPPTEEALRIKNHLTPPHRPLGNAAGYRGLLDKTRDVPNLMDGAESETTQSSVSGTNYGNTNFRFRPRRIAIDPEDHIQEESSDIFDEVARGSGDTESDVFDGLNQSSEYLQRTPSIPEESQYTLGAVPRNDNQDLNLVLLGGGLTTIQTTPSDFTNRKTASDFDENLTNSDYDQYGFARIPGFNEMATAGKRHNDMAFSGVNSKLFSQANGRGHAPNRHFSNRSDIGGSEVSGSSVFSDEYEVDSWAGFDLQQYYVHPDEMKPLVKKFRKMSSKLSATLSPNKMTLEEDATKSFALMEMRSRIMEKDIERGLERRGGTSVVDDIVLTKYNRTAMRVRDATIVAKAWRDGATPKDVINTALLTQREERTFFIPRVNNSLHQRCTWEEVTWYDDMELSLHRCHSIGPRHLRGFEMFTIGDCQSILLKLCNQQCLELREQLNEATAIQLEAEDDMKAEEVDAGSFGMMTETEMRYLTSMEDVKTISHKLVFAEKAFTLVRDRIEKLVRQYEALLVKLDNDAGSVAPSSVITDASSYYSDYTAGTFQEDQERETLARRAQRAELRAELAAREAMLTKQRARDFRREKEMEIKELRQRLNDLQSESSAAIAEREHSVVLARAITLNRMSPGSQVSHTKPVAGMAKVEEVKQRFRNRSAKRTNSNYSKSAPASSRGFKSSTTLRRKYPDQNVKNQSAMFRAVGEEMFQHLDFYERSLKAVEDIL